MAEPDKNQTPPEAPKTEVDKILKEMLDKKQEPPLDKLKTILSEVDSQAKGEKTTSSSLTAPVEKAVSQPEKAEPAAVLPVISPPVSSQEGGVKSLLESPAVVRLEKIISEFRSRKTHGAMRAPNFK